MGAKCLKKPKDHDAFVSSPSVESEPSQYSEDKEKQNLFFNSNFEMIDVAKALIISALSKNHLLKDITQADHNMVFKSLQMCTVSANLFIFKQGSTGSLFFIINSGTVEEIVDGTRRRTLLKGTCFGYMAMISSSRRHCSMKTLTNCSFWVMPKDKFTEILKKISQRNYDKIKKLIYKGHFFSSLVDSKKDLLAKAAILHKYEGGETIINDGDDGDLLFVLISGTIVFQKGIQQISKVSMEGEIFGESALFSGSKRTASCAAVGRTEAISIDRRSLQSIFGIDYSSFLLKNIARRAICADPHLSFFDQTNVLEITEKLKWVEYEDGDLVIPDNKSQKVFQVICSGSIYSKSAKKKINSFQVIGLNNLNQLGLDPDGYLSEGQTIIGEVSVTIIESILGMKFEELAICLETLKFLKKVHIFKLLSLKSLKLLSESAKVLTFNNEETIFLDKSPADSLYIVKSGMVGIVKGNKILRLIGKNDIFGERCVYDKYRSASAYCHENSEILIISKASLISLTDKGLLKPEIDRKRLYQCDILLDSLILTVEYPKDSLGRLHYCSMNPSNSTQYSLIVIPKHTLKTIDDCEKLVKEKEILIQLDHRLVAKLVTSTRNDKYIFFITQKIFGGSLRAWIPNTEAYSKIFVLHLSALLEYLHQRNIIYRDLSPDNILISPKGLPYLVKFHSAKIVTDRTYTKVGDPSYMAPEMMLDSGYTKSCDYWSLGVILYELLYGTLPYNTGQDDDPQAIYKKIVESKLVFPNHSNDLVNSLISRLLDSAEKRADYNFIMKSLWLNNMDIEKILFIDGEVESPSNSEENLEYKQINASVDLVLSVTNI